MVGPGLPDRLGPSVAPHLLPNRASVDFEAFRNRAGALAVTPRGSDRVHFRLRQRCSGPSHWGQHHSSLGFRRSWLLSSDTRFRLLPRGTQPFELLPRVRAESTGVHSCLHRQPPAKITAESWTSPPSWSLTTALFRGGQATTRGRELQRGCQPSHAPRYSTFCTSQAASKTTAFAMAPAASTPTPSSDR